MAPKEMQNGVVDQNGVLWKATSVGKFASIPEPGVTTIWESLVASVQKHSDRQACGWRTVVKREMEEGEGGKQFEKYTLGPYNWLTYSEYFKTIEAFSTVLIQKTGLGPKDRMVIFAETQKEWMIAAYAAWRQNVTVVTIYATLGEDGAQHGIEQTKASVVVADAKLLKVLAGVAAKCKSLKHVVTITEGAGDSKLSAAGIQLHDMSAMIKEGTGKPVVDPVPPNADDVAIIMYTSGTTGLPKGVVIPHSAVIGVVAGTLSKGAILSNDVRALDETDVYLAYLPLAHIMELAVEVTLFYRGLAVGYGSPHTLTPTSVKMKQTEPPQQGDAQALRPTLMVFAPAVLDRVYAGVKAKVAKGSALKQKLFQWALASGISNYEAGGVGAWFLYDKIVFANVQALLGGRVRAMLAGSAPLSGDVQKFVQSCFNAPLRQGYGLTETCAATCIATMADNTTGQVGPPQESACIRLRDWPEGNYLVADKDKPEIGMMRGEILIGGPAVCAGYWVDPSKPDKEVEKKNKEDFVVVDGIRYFCTGDIGQITPSGNLQIIDRKKDLVKLQQGEYVALSKVENVLKNSKYTQIPLVFADSTKSYCIALICPQPANLATLAKDLDVEGDLKAWCANEKVQAAVLADVKAVCKAGKLAGFETPNKVVLIDDEWSVENDMLTTTLKVKRKPIADKHKAQIDAVYK